MPIKIRKIAVEAEYPAHARERPPGISGAPAYGDHQRIGAPLRDTHDDWPGQTLERAQIAAV